MARQTPEGALLHSICQYLAVKGYFFYRTNSVGIYDASQGTWRKLAKWSMRGVADIFVLHSGHAYFIEVKATTKQSGDQMLFEKKVTNHGGTYILAYSLQDVESILS